MGDFSEFLGWATVVFSALAIGDFVLKRLNKLVIKYIPAESPLRGYYKLILKLFIRFHKLFGLVAVAFAITHFLSQYFYGEVAITGVIAVCTLAMMGITGIVLATVHGGSRALRLNIHRCVAISIILAVAVHLLVVG
jgi:hypothetical protein